LSAVPTFLVVGAGRSGTTALAEGLRAHPEVFVTRPKEPHYFALHGTTPNFQAPGDAATINRVAVTGRDAYLALYQAQERRTARGEASVSTLYYHERAIPEIQRLAPDARIVILLREPVERAGSAFDYMTARGFETAADLLQGVREEDDRVASNWHHLWHYTRMSKYATAVEAFQSAFGRERVGIWYYDDLRRDYASTLREVLRFIGTAPSEGEGAAVPVVNASGSPRNKLFQSAVQTATRAEPVRRTVKMLTPYRAREAVRRRLLTRNEVSVDVRAELAPLFREDLRRLRRLVDLDRAPLWITEAR
jgi:hypothetical protein